MSYPQGPSGSPGYPPAQQPTTQFSAPTQQFGKLPDVAPAAEGPSKLPVYLTAAVAALGLAVYVSSYGPLLGAGADATFSPPLLDLGVVASLLGALIAGVSLVPKQKAAPALVAVLSVLGFLLVINIVLGAPRGVEIKWGLYLIIAFSVLQAIVAVAVLLFDAGVLTPPAPRPRYEQQQQQYGQYGAPGPYYGQPHQPGPPHQQAPQLRPGYPSPYPGGYPGGPPAGGFSGGPQAGPATPPSGFPAYGQPPSSNAPTTQVPAQQASSTQSGPPPS
jgi:hypothetical protein